MFEFRKKFLDEKRANKSRIESKYPIKSTKESTVGARSSTNQFSFLSRQDLVISSNRSSNSSSARSSTSRSSIGGSKAKTSTPSSNHFYLHTRQQDLLRPLIEKARAAIQKVAKAQGFDYVIDATPGGALILFEGKDLMAEVKTELGF